MRFLACLGSSLLLAACAGQPAPIKPQADCAVLSVGRYCLQPSAAMSAFEVQQTVEARMGGRRETMIVELSNDERGLHFVALTPFGHKLLELGLDRSGVVHGTTPDGRLSPALLLGLMQIALWPADRVDAGLSPNLRLIENGMQRQVLEGQRVVLSVQRFAGPAQRAGMRLALPDDGVELNIEEIAPLEAP